MSNHRSCRLRIVVILIIKIKIIRKPKSVVGRFVGNRGPALAWQSVRSELAPVGETPLGA